MSKTKNACLEPKCAGKVYARGVCNNCYQRFRYQVEVAGSTTWKKLENAGLVLPARRK